MKLGHFIFICLLAMVVALVWILISIPVHGAGPVTFKEKVAKHIRDDPAGYFARPKTTQALVVNLETLTGRLKENVVDIAYALENREVRAESIERHMIDCAAIQKVLDDRLHRLWRITLEGTRR